MAKVGRFFKPGTRLLTHASDGGPNAGAYPSEPVAISATWISPTAVSVNFIPPASSGGEAVRDYTVTSDPGGFTATGTASPIIVSGLDDSNSYDFTVRARNAYGAGPASAPVSVSGEGGTVTWDAANKGAGVVLSNGDLTATGSGAQSVRATTAHAGGPNCFGITPSAIVGAYLGVVDGSFDVGGVDLYGGGAWVLTPYYGGVFSDGSYSMIEFSSGDGEEVFTYIKPIGGGLAGIWFDTVADLTLVDREAGTNPHATLPAATAVYPAAVLPAGQTGTLDPDHSSGSFAAWSP